MSLSAGSHLNSGENREMPMPTGGAFKLDRFGRIAAQ